MSAKQKGHSHAVAAARLFDGISLHQDATAIIEGACIVEIAPQV
jgi:hypothetical protein